MRSNRQEERSMKSNFDFLNRYWPALAQIGATAEGYVYSDPNACLYKLGMFGERLVLEIFAFEHKPFLTFLPRFNFKRKFSRILIVD